LQNIGPSISAFGLDKMGFGGVGTAHWNYTTAALITEALSRGEGRLAEGGALVVETGVHTGRSANDKFVVEEETSKDNIWWGKVNKPIEPEKFDAMLSRVQEYLNGREVFVQDCWAGAMKGDRLAVLEAMKMEHSLLAARDGVVAEVLATAGDQVEAGAALVRLEAEEEAAA